MSVFFYFPLTRHSLHKPMRASCKNRSCHIPKPAFFLDGGGGHMILVRVMFGFVFRSWEDYRFHRILTNPDESACRMGSRNGFTWVSLQFFPPSFLRTSIHILPPIVPRICPFTFEGMGPPRSPANGPRPYSRRPPSRRRSTGQTPGAPRESSFRDTHSSGPRWRWSLFCESTN